MLPDNFVKAEWGVINNNNSKSCLLLRANLRPCKILAVSAVMRRLARGYKCPPEGYF